jgi:hypothetical protein
LQLPPAGSAYFVAQNTTSTKLLQSPPDPHLTSCNLV